MYGECNEIFLYNPGNGEKDGDKDSEKSDLAQEHNNSYNFHEDFLN
jgi:hypothetical protein